jgi:hypothetical protein
MGREQQHPGIKGNLAIILVNLQPAATPLSQQIIKSGRAIYMNL